ncbi:hypothetical protein ACUNV4_23920 [Granulosicoccus sp. 3-233]|uniref:hypothetical protein n=1 Tax=Granulosicoccus sp. 3-233 TaxID=3417969 RepID=UPI003D33756C
MGISSSRRLSPTERVDALYLDLCRHYEGGDDKEVRAAAKLLLVALARLREHGGANWDVTLDAYVKIAKNRPEKLANILRQGNSGRKSM